MSGYGRNTGVTAPRSILTRRTSSASDTRSVPCPVSLSYPTVVQWVMGRASDFRLREPRLEFCAAM